MAHDKQHKHIHLNWHEFSYIARKILSDIQNSLHINSGTSLVQFSVSVYREEEKGYKFESLDQNPNQFNHDLLLLQPTKLYPPPWRQHAAPCYSKPVKAARQCPCRWRWTRTADNDNLSIPLRMSSCDGTKPRRRCHKYRDAANTISLLILLTASSSLASSWVSPIDWDARISC